MFLSQSAPNPISHESSVSFSKQTALVQSVTSLSCLILAKDDTQSDKPRKFCFDFNIDDTYTIGHIIFLFGPVRTLSDRSRQLSFVFNTNYMCTISHVVVLSSFHHSRRPIRSIMKVQYHFQRRLHLSIQSHHCLVQFSSWTTPSQLVMITLFHFRSRPYLYDWSSHCHIWFSSQNAPVQIGLDNLVQFQLRTNLYDQSHCYPIQFSSQIVSDLIEHDSSISFLTQMCPVPLVTSLSYLIFITNHTCSNRS